MKVEGRIEVGRSIKVEGSIKVGGRMKAGGTTTKVEGEGTKGVVLWWVTSVMKEPPLLL